jgi:hypothetical protein
MTRRIKEVEVALPRKRQCNHSNPQYPVVAAEDSKIEIEDTTTAAAVAVGGWIYGEYTSSTCGRRRSSAPWMIARPPLSHETMTMSLQRKKGKRFPLLKSLLLTSFLLAPMNHQCADNTTESSLQSPTAVSMPDHCLVHPSWTDSRGVQW